MSCGWTVDEGLFGIGLSYPWSTNSPKLILACVLAVAVEVNSRTGAPAGAFPSIAAVVAKGLVIVRNLGTAGCIVIGAEALSSSSRVLSPNIVGFGTYPPGHPGVVDAPPKTTGCAAGAIASLVMPGKLVFIGGILVGVTAPELPAFAMLSVGNFGTENSLRSCSSCSRRTRAGGSPNRFSGCRYGVSGLMDKPELSEAALTVAVYSCQATDAGTSQLCETLGGSCAPFHGSPGLCHRGSPLAEDGVGVFDRDCEVCEVVSPEVTSLTM